MCRNRRSTLLLFLLPVLFVPALRAQSAPDTEVERGKYLVEGVAGCGDCHTPFTAQGEPDMSRWLQGATLSFQPVQPMPNWAKVAPPLAGLPGWTEADAVQLLRTGRNRDGKPPRPPMPQYRCGNMTPARWWPI